QPLDGHACLVAAVVERDDLALEEGVQRVCVRRITALVVVVRAPAAYGPAVVALEALLPPAVEDREVEHPVHRGLLAAGPRRLEGTAWVVEPDVDTARQRPPDGHVVVLDEVNAASEALVVGQPVDAGDQLLALVVGRMGLAGEHELHRSLEVREDRAEAIRVAEDERRALVGGETPSEADRERVGVEERLGARERARARLVAPELPREPTPQEAQALPLQGAPHLPQPG